MVRKATIDDLNQVYKLYQEASLDISRLNESVYAAKVQREGFLVALEGKDELAERIEKNFLFQVYEEDREILGYININKEIYFPEGEDNIIWFDKTLEQSYFHATDSITLHEIIVRKDSQQKGVGSQLLESCFHELQKNTYHHLFSIVTLAPITNCPSLIFHAKNGFERACVTMPFDLFDMKNYMSVLFHKEIL